MDLAIRQWHSGRRGARRPLPNAPTTSRNNKIGQHVTVSPKEISRCRSRRKQGKCRQTPIKVLPNTAQSHAKHGTKSPHIERCACSHRSKRARAPFETSTRTVRCEPTYHGIGHDFGRQTGKLSATSSKTISPQARQHDGNGEKRKRATRPTSCSVGVSPAYLSVRLKACRAVSMAYLTTTFFPPTM